MEDEVVFLDEEAGTSRTSSGQSRSNSAGEPIVISSDEEEESMASRLSTRRPLSPTHRHHYHHHEHHSPRNMKRLHHSRSPCSKREPRHRHRHHSRHHSKGHSRGHGSTRADPIVLSPDSRTGPMDHYVRRFKSSPKLNGSHQDHFHRNHSSHSHFPLSPDHRIHRPPLSSPSSQSYSPSSHHHPRKLFTEPNKTIKGKRPHYAGSDTTNRSKSPLKRRKLSPSRNDEHASHSQRNGTTSHHDSGWPRLPVKRERASLPYHCGHHRSPHTPTLHAVSGHVSMQAMERERRRSGMTQVKTRDSTPESSSVKKHKDRSSASQSQTSSSSKQRQLGDYFHDPDTTPPLRRATPTIRPTRYVREDQSHITRDTATPPPSGVKRTPSSSSLTPSPSRKTGCSAAAPPHTHRPPTSSSVLHTPPLLPRTPPLSPHTSQLPPHTPPYSTPSLPPHTPPPHPRTPPLPPCTPSLSSHTPPLRPLTPELPPPTPPLLPLTPQLPPPTPPLLPLTPQLPPPTPPLLPLTPQLPPPTPPLLPLTPPLCPPHSDVNQAAPSKTVCIIPSWTEAELKMKGELCALPSTEVQIPGLHISGSSSPTRALSAPATTCSWNYVKVYMEGRDDVKFVEVLGEITSTRRYVPDSEVEAVLKCVLSITDCTLLTRLHSVLATDASLRPNVTLSANQLWELMDTCCRRLLPANTVVTHTSPISPSPYSHSAHVVLLYLVSLLAADLANHEESLSAALMARTLSLTTQWRRVVVIVDLLLELFLLHTRPSPTLLPDLPPVLAALLCMCASCECDDQDSVMRLARELSSRVSKISSIQLKTDLLLLLPCHRLREMTISIHLQTEFLLPTSASSSPQQSPSPLSEHVTLNLIATHLSRCPCHHDGSPHNLSYFLSLLVHLLLSHCSRLLGPSSYLCAHSTSWTTLPSELAQQLQSIAQQIQRLPLQISEDDRLLPELTSPRCWFYLEVLESMFKWDHISK